MIFIIFGFMRLLCVGRGFSLGEICNDDGLHVCYWRGDGLYFGFYFGVGVLDLRCVKNI